MAVVTKDDLTWVRFGSAPLIVTLVLPLIIGVILLLKCILNHCCVRKSTAKEEMYGVEGRMTILLNSETSFGSPSPPPPTSSSSQQQQIKPVSTTTSSRTSNELLLPNSNRSSTSKEPSKVHHHQPQQQQLLLHQLGNESSSSTPSSPAPSEPAITTTTTTTTAVTSAHPTESYETIDLTDSVKSSTLHRQLPDLPQPPNNLLGPNPPRRSSSVLSHDGTSELYATVGELPNPNIPAHSSNNGKVRKDKGTAGSSRGSKPGTSKSAGTKTEPNPSSDSETYGNNLVNHPYAKLKRNVAEHPYARVRTGSTGTGGDEETDTDNYDTPQPYAQTGRNALGARLAHQTASTSGQGSAAVRESVERRESENSSEAGAAPAGNPVPPRRTGRQWRRGSHPPAQAYDNQPQHFSGDSQDSRGYTSISVREPLSNIIASRNPNNPRTYDSHYATVSDDSEEMYAAIEDAEGNYMRIPGEDGEPGSRHWHGPGVASPIPERREANSPLPPPPVPPLASPPELSPTGPAAPASLQPEPVQPAAPNSSIPPVYAQVTKKSKKAKAPVTPTASAPSSQPLAERKPVSATSSLPPGSSPQLSSSASTPVSNVKPRNHPDKATTLLSPSADSEPRRWSKADISYSEFEVVREPLYSTPRKPPAESSSSSHHEKPARKPRTTEEVDEDNYNVIPEGRVSRGSRAGSGKSLPHRPPESNNYQEIGELDIVNPYQEIQPKESDYYQEIGRGAGMTDDNRDGLGSNLYQEIDKSVPGPSRRDDPLEEEEDPADQFYETVKPAAKLKHLPSPSHSQGSVTSLDRKHGYEKLKKKPGSPTVVVIASDDDDDEDEDTKNEDSLYERVKYPPYERLKESRDDLRDLPLDSTESDRFYEDIGYSRVKSRKIAAAEAVSHEEPGPSTSRSSVEIEHEGEPNNLDQLYARVDKTKKKKHTNNNNQHNINNNNNNNDNSHSSTTATVSVSTTTTTILNDSHDDPPRIEICQEKAQACIVLRTDNKDEDESIEYI